MTTTRQCGGQRPFSTATHRHRTADAHVRTAPGIDALTFPTDAVLAALCDQPKMHLKETLRPPER